MMDRLLHRPRSHVRKLYQDISWALYVRKHKHDRRRHVTQALSVAGHVELLICGDSHAELTSAFFEPNEAMNCAVVGSTAKTCRTLLAGTRISKTSDFAVLIIGTNDLSGRNHEAPREVGRFVADVTAIVGKLQRRARHVLISALPPADVDKLHQRPPRSIEVYSRALEALGREHGCRFIDPFAHIRSGQFGVAIPGAFSDGLHLSDYRPVGLSIQASLRAALVD